MSNKVFQYSSNISSISIQIETFLYCSLADFPLEELWSTKYFIFYHISPILLSIVARWYFLLVEEIIRQEQLAIGQLGILPNMCFSKYLLFIPGSKNVSALTYTSILSAKATFLNSQLHLKTKLSSSDSDRIQDGRLSLRKHHWLKDLDMQSTMTYRVGGARGRVESLLCI